MANKPSIEPIVNGPNRVTNLKALRNSIDEALEKQQELII